jgi:hypothetical protein
MARKADGRTGRTTSCPTHRYTHTYSAHQMSEPHTYTACPDHPPKMLHLDLLLSFFLPLFFLFSPAYRRNTGCSCAVFVIAVRFFPPLSYSLLPSIFSSFIGTSCTCFFTPASCSLLDISLLYLVRFSSPHCMRSLFTLSHAGPSISSYSKICMVYIASA